MVSRREKLLRKMLQALDGPAPLSTNKGPIVHTPRYISKKDKRNSGRISPRISHPKMKYSEIFDEGLDEQDFYDDWQDWRDGQRAYFRDASRFKKNTRHKYFDSPYVKEWQKPNHVNKKLTRELRIRKAAKFKQRFRKE